MTLINICWQNLLTWNSCTAGNQTHPFVHLGTVTAWWEWCQLRWVGQHCKRLVTKEEKWGKTKPQTNKKGVAEVSRKAAWEYKCRKIGGWRPTSEKKKTEDQTGQWHWKSRGRDCVLMLERKKDVKQATWKAAQQLSAREAPTCQCWIHRPDEKRAMMYSIISPWVLTGSQTGKKETSSLTKSPVFPWLLCYWSLSVSGSSTFAHRNTYQPIILQLTLSLIPPILKYPAIPAPYKYLITHLLKCAVCLVLPWHSLTAISCIWVHLLCFNVTSGEYAKHEGIKCGNKVCRFIAWLTHRNN